MRANVKVSGASQLAGEASDSTAVLGAWLPIETAPKIGRILVFNPMVGVYSSEYVEERKDEPGKMTSECEITWTGFPLGLWGRLGKWYCVPTHWMPLPKAPNVK